MSSIFVTNTIFKLYFSGPLRLSLTVFCGHGFFLGHDHLSNEGWRVSLHLVRICPLQLHFQASLGHVPWMGGFCLRQGLRRTHQLLPLLGRLCSLGTPDLFLLPHPFWHSTNVLCQPDLHYWIQRDTDSKLYTYYLLQKAEFFQKLSFSKSAQKTWIVDNSKKCTKNLYNTFLPQGNLWEYLHIRLILCAFWAKLRFLTKLRAFWPKSGLFW